MVCIYCASPTQVVNSRHQRSNNQIWRRRQCTDCKAVFTTHESVVLDNAILVQYSKKHTKPFSRDKLFMSIYECCKHRPKALEEADGLTKTTLAKLRNFYTEGVVTPDILSTIAHDVLSRFDATAASLYAAYHPHTD